MRRYPGIPELVESVMNEYGSDERWITPHEIRDRYGLTRYQSNTVSAFLRRLASGPFGTFPFIVMKIEMEKTDNPSDPKKYRYLLKRRRASPAQQSGNGFPRLEKM